MSEIKKAIESKDLDAVSRLTQTMGLEAMLQERDALGRGPMHWAAKANLPSLIDWLAAQGANPNDADSADANTPLIVAAMNGSSGAASALIKAGASVGAKNRGGRDALMFATAVGHAATRDVLLGSGADATAKDASGQTAQDLAQGVAEEARKAAARQLVHQERPSWMANFPGAMPGELLGGKLADGPSEAPASGDPAAAEEALAPLPPVVAKLSPAKQEAYRKLIALGLEDLTSQATNDPYSGREVEAEKICAMMAKEQNPLMIGAGGVGKTATAMLVAERLGREGKLLMQVPSSLLRGNKYAGSVNENIQKWLPLALSLRPELAIFVDEAQVLSTGKTSSDSNDTPMQVLKEYLDSTGSKRLIMLGATSEKEAEALNEDEGFKRLVTPYHINPMTLDQTRSVLKDANTRKRLERSGYEIDSEASFDALIDQCLPLLDGFIFNQSFPKKAFDFVAHALRDTPSSSLDADQIERAFASFFSIPIELVKGEIAEGSVYADLEDTLNSRLIGQKDPINKLAAAVRGGILLNGGGARTPISLMMMGPTGVGKTEASESLARELGLPILSFNMGEYKTPSQVMDLLDKISTFLTKNYSGVILFDEIEKANPQTLDLLLNLLDKGSIGSGAAKVCCGSQIVICTTNIGAKDTMRIKKELKRQYGTLEIDEDWLRERLIEEGMRPELVNRLTKVLDFNFISPDDALVIGEMMFAKKAKSLKESKGITLNFAPDFITHQILNGFDENFGARGVARSVNETFEKLINQKDVLLKMRRGTVIEVSDTAGELHLTITDAKGQTSKSHIVNERKDSKGQLASVFNSMKEMARVVEHRATQSAPAPARAKSAPGAG